MHLTFDPVSHPEFNSDDAVIRHEIGHIISWWKNGGQIGKLVLSRSRTSQVSHPHATFPGTETLDVQLDGGRLAERWLAGESAARKALGMPRDQICTDGVVITSKSDIPLLLNGTDERQDFARVIWIAHTIAKNTWYDWVEVRLLETVAVVDAHWGAIEQIARTLMAKCPGRGGLVEVPDVELVGLLNQADVHRSP
jgi:hypothetical protein